MNIYHRKDSLEKALGTAQYTDDLDIGDYIYGLPVGVPISKGILNEIIFDPNFDWSEYTICTSRDLSVENILPPKISDEPILLDKEVLYYGQPAVLIGHKNEKVLKQAASHISFKYSEEAPVFGIDIKKQTNKVFTSKTLSQGDVELGFSESDHVIEGFYTTQAQEHLYLETQIIIAKADIENKKLFIEGSMQAPFNIQAAVERSFKNRFEEIVVIPHLAGGAFGGREDFTTQVALHATLLAIKSGQKVKIKLSREYDLTHSTKRHPSSTRVKVGIKNDKINALEVDFLLDGGAYETISDIVLSRSMLHPGSFNSPNIKVTGKAVQTNTPPNGAFRGFGAPQTFFAVESHLDFCIRKLNLDPVAFRNNNLLTATSRSLSGQTLGLVGVNVVYKNLLKQSDYLNLKTEVEDFNKSHNKVKKGLGIATVFHGTGYTGYQDIDTPVSINLVLHQNGFIDIESSVIEFGQGSHSLLPQIVSNVLNIPIERITVKNISTKETPSSGATVASRSAAVLGSLVERAAQKLLPYLDDPKELSISESYHREEPFDYETMQGHAYENYASAATLSLIEVDLQTYSVKVQKIFASIDAGQIINKVDAEGQVQGGILQGLGLALSEEMKIGEKGYQNQILTNYNFPTSEDSPEIVIDFIDDNQVKPKGLGEIPLCGVAPSIANALEDALGVRLHNLPLTPEKIEKALR